MTYASKKKKKTIISAVCVLLLLIGSFYLGRFSKGSKSSEPKNNLPNNSQEIQKLKNELNLVKSQLNQSNINQKSQLEGKLSNIENKIKTLTSRDKSTIQELEREIKEIKEKIKNDKPKDNPPPYTPPTDENQLQFTVYYFTALGRNHMWVDVDGNSDKILLIDKENSIFQNNELIKKGSWCTITFSPQDAERFRDRDDNVYYFNKNNNKFTLKPHNPEPDDKKEEKASYIGMSYDETSRKSRYAVFDNFTHLLDSPDENPIIKTFHISKNHPRIKQLLSEGKLQQGKKFTICYGKVDKKSEKGVYNVFNENNQDLEITEA